MVSISGLRHLVALVGFALVSGFALTAHAAPQALGLVASSEPLPLICEGGECQVHLSAFCLQETREIPPLGTSYQLVAPTSVKLMLTTAEGRKVEVPAAGTVTFTTYRAFTAIRASVSSRVLAAQGAVAAALVIDQDALLIPRTEAGDRNPQTQADIDLARENLRPAAAAFFDTHGVEADAAKLVNRLINALPERARAPALEDGHLWPQVISPEMVAETAPAAVRWATEIHESCRASRSLGKQYSMRRCLESAHAALMRDVNVTFWQSLGES
jgi:hypothetical protein